MKSPWQIHSLTAFMSFTRTQLHNGITLLVDSDTRFNSVALCFCLRGGLRDETPETVGISHILEHLLFKRSGKRSQRDIAEFIDSVGGQVNASTDTESICLYGVVPGERLPELVDFFSELLTDNAVLEEDFELEREVIAQEMSEAEDSVFDVLIESLSKTMWKGSVLGFPVFGTRASLESFTLSLVKQRLSELCVGSRLVIAASGNVDKSQLVKTVEKHFSNIPEGRKARKDNASFHSGLELIQKQATQVYMALAFPWPSLLSEQYISGIVGASALGEGVSSRLFQLLREEHGLTYDISATIDSYTDVGACIISGAFEPKNVEQALTLLHAELESIREEGLSQEEFYRVKRSLLSHVMLERDRHEDRLWRSVNSELWYGRNVSLDEVQKSLEQLTLKEVNKCLNQWILNKKALLVLCGDVASVIVPEKLKAVCQGR